jgi:hypothetical protein
MTFSYSNPQHSELDAVRYLIGDTDSNGPLVTDEEIEYAISKWMPLYGTLEWVASTVLETLAGRYAREASFSADGVSVSLSNLQQQFAAQAEKLRNQHKNSFVGALVDVGGVSPYEGLEPGNKPFAFGTGMHDNVSAGFQDSAGEDPIYYVPEEHPGY